MENHSQRATPNSPLLTRNPYVGPRAFEAADRANFFGRDTEIRQLADLVVAQRAVLLYASSGAGKTSLINAGLIPALQRRRMTALPVARVGGSAPAEAANPFVFNLLSSLADETVAPETLLKMSLREGLSPGSPLALDVASGARLLVLDQFEELFTQHAGRPAAREDFFAQLQDALEVFPHLGLLLAMREEYLAYLDSFSAMLPDRLRARFRLELLDESAARLALQAPARAAGVPFDDDAARHLVDDLRRVQVQQLDGCTVSALGPAVEPVQLQVVAYRLWESLPPGANHIGVDALAGLGDVNRALRDYYAQSVARIAAETGVAERAIREWVERQLMTAQGRRDVVARGPEFSGGLANAAIGRLVGVHLVRAEQRTGATWYELAHDRLVEPLQADNAAWFAEHLSLLQRQAALWDEEKRPAGLLLSGGALAEAEACVASYDGDLTPTERNFLTACREAQARARREQQQTRRIRWLAVGTTVLMLVALATAFFAWGQMQRAEDAQREAVRLARIGRARELAALAQAINDPTGSLNLMLARESAFTTWLTDTEIITQSFVTNETLAGLQLAVFNVQHLPWRTTIPWRTRGPAAFSPDGTRIVSGNENQTLRVWDVQTGEELLQLIGHTGFVQSVAYSPDGMQIVSGSGDGTVWVWDAQTGADVQQLIGHTDGVLSVAYSPDGTRIVSGSGDQTVRIWDAQMGVEVQQLTGHTGSVNAVAYSPDGMRIVSGSSDRTVRVWDAQTGVEVQQLTGHTDFVRTVAYSPDGTRIVSGGHDMMVRVWDAWSGAKVQLLSGHAQAIEVVAYSPDGTRIVSGESYENPIMRVWDTQTGVELLRLIGHTDPIQAITYSLEGKHIISASADQTLRVWDVSATLNTSAQPNVEVQQLAAHVHVMTVVYSPDGTRIVSGGYDGLVRVWDVATGVVIQRWVGHTYWVWALAYNPEGTRIVSIGTDSEWKMQVRVWDAQSGQALREWTRHTGDIFAVAYSPDGTRIFSESTNGTVHVWDAETGAEVQQLTGHTDAVTAVAYSPDGTRIVGGSRDQTVRVWDAATGVEVQQLTGHTDSVRTVAYSPDGTRIVSGSGDRTVRMWDAQMGTEVLKMIGHTGPVEAVAYSPDGTRIVSGSWDGTVRIWDAQTGTEIQQLALVRSDRVFTVAYSPEGTRIVIGGEEGAIWIWNTAMTSQASIDRLRVAQCAGHDGWVHAVEYHPDGQSILIASDDKTKQMFWEDADYLLRLADCLIQRNPQVFVGDERSLYGFDVWPAAEH